ncbi:hypothetical protein HanRHA438_Chr16g0780611 [Helianthus annuus]|nr:hypothetical protein HanRHA438_Chr16g0780611 [Helianthus annuus]
MLILSPKLVHNFSNNLHQCRDSSNRPCLRVAEPAYGCRLVSELELVFLFVHINLPPEIFEDGFCVVLK